MKNKKYIQSLTIAALALGALTLSTHPALAANVAISIKAEARNVTLPDGVSVPMWGFFDSTDTGSAWIPGPTLTLTEGDNLTIYLANSLPEAVSIVIPGQMKTLTPSKMTDPQGRVRVTGFDSGASFTWNNLKPGTYLYQSGTHPALQVPMGLYGALIVDPATAGSAYAPTANNSDTAYNTEMILLYSEIDVDLHNSNPPGVAQPLNYIPEYYLINGLPYRPGDFYPAGNLGEATLIRFLNAGLKTHVPTLLNAPYMHLIAEDGNLYPYAKEQYTVPLAAGKTMDVIWHPTSEGTVSLVDSTNYLADAGALGGGMLAQLQVGSTTGGNNQPVAQTDSYSTAAGVALTVAAPGVLANDTDADGDALTAVLASDVSGGSLTLNSNGSFSYTANNATTSDSFIYTANDGTVDSAPVTVYLTVDAPINNPPVAQADNYSATAGVALSVAAPGVLANDTDADGDALTAVLASDVSGGSLTLNSNGSFSYTANNATTSDSFTYTANDGTVDSAPVLVSFMVSAPASTAPIAVDDSVTTTQRTININLAANDTDPDNNLLNGSGNVPASRITVETPPTQGSIVRNITNGVRYRAPTRNFTGTITFTYTVTDLSGQKSNIATVTVTKQ